MGGASSEHRAGPQVDYLTNELFRIHISAWHVFTTLHGATCDFRQSTSIMLFNFLRDSVDIKNV